MGHSQESTSSFRTKNGIQIFGYSKHLSWQSAKLLGAKKSHHDNNNNY